MFEFMTTERRQTVTLIILLAALVVNLIVMVQNWQLYSRVRLLESAVSSQREPTN